MRNAFADEITKLAAADERIVLLSGDIGNRLFDGYKARQKERFFNCGVAEANMVGTAAGMALCGLRPVAYTIAPFLVMRAYEQIRVDLAYQNLPVVIVGVGAGYSYADLNSTHHSCEDIGIMRILPNMKVVCPGDEVELRPALRAALKENGPVYLRMGKKGEPIVHATEPELTIGKGIVIREGRDVALLSTGNILPEAVLAAESLARDGLSVKLVSLHTVKPLDQDLLAAVFAECRLVATVEEHSVIGGLGGAVAEWLAARPALAPSARLLSLGAPDRFIYRAGDQAHVRERCGLTAAGIVARIMNSDFARVPR